jgi:hypothetical protein
MPSIVSSMSSLQVIVLYYNKLSGGLPEEMFNLLPNLQRLGLSYNQFYGQLPSILFRCQQLQNVLTNIYSCLSVIPWVVRTLAVTRSVDWCLVKYVDWAFIIPFYNYLFCLIQNCYASKKLFNLFN